MRVSHLAVRQRSNSPQPNFAATRGFSLVELLVAMAIFLIVSAAAFSLFNQHSKIVVRQQNLSGVNIGLRNAMSQMEMDLSAAGQNLLAGLQGSAPSFSLGPIIHNNVPGTATTCTPNTTNWSYPVPSSCFDSLTIVNAKPCTAAGGTTAPPLVVDDPGGQPEVLNSSVLWATDPNNPDNNTTALGDSPCFKQGDELLVVYIPSSGQQPTCDNGQFNYCVGIITLTKDGQANGNGRIQLQHNPTGSGTDPLGLIFNTSGGNNFNKANGLNFAYPNGSSYIIDLGDGSSAITYAVLPDPGNASNPQLLRCTGTSCTGSNGQVVTDQVIGFKIGAALWDNAQVGATDIANYFYDSTKYCNDAVSGADCTATPPPANDANDFTLVRAVRVSMIGRTSPYRGLNQTGFRNGFDNGPYLVQQASVVVDLRNMSINDFGN